MDKANPYQAPKATTVAATVAGADYRYDGKYLWIRDKAVLPDRCIYTNLSREESGGLTTTNKKIAWASPWALLIILLNLLLYLLVALFIQKKAQVEFSISSDIARKKKVGMILGCIGLLTSLGLIIFTGVNADSQLSAGLLGSLLGVGVIGTVVSVVVVFRAGNTISASKFSDGWFRLRGPKEPFLSSLTNAEGEQ